MFIIALSFVRHPINILTSSSFAMIVTSIDFGAFHIAVKFFIQLMPFVMSKAFSLLVVYMPIVYLKTVS